MLSKDILQPPLLLLWVCVHLFINLDERMVIGIEVLADGGLEAGWSGAFLAEAFILAFHAVHVGRRTTQVADVALEVLHLGDLLHLVHDGFLAP